MSDERAAAAAAIVFEPEAYKVCDQCESILRNTAAICVICHSYRWRLDENEVCRVAMLLGSRPPMLAAVLPRI
jgi:Zn finger protein HypA/HybF involved in hydrogenase expression